MSVQIGAGGIISDIYQKYHSFDSLITLEWDSIHSGQDLYEIYQPDNIYQWINEKNGFHSEIAISFQKTIYFKTFSNNDVSRISISTCLENGNKI